MSQFNGYSKGGKPHPMHVQAETLRRQGQRGDKVLAHINPAEAKMLEQRFGRDINPHTGLPQYGLLSGIFGKKKTNPVTGEQTRSGLRGMVHNIGLNKVEKAVRPIAKPLLPIVGSIGGLTLGGPLGAIIGGGLGGGLSSKRHPLDHALGGLGIGLGSAMLAPKLGGMFGVNPHSGMGEMLGMGHEHQGFGGLMSQLGLGGHGAHGAASGLAMMGEHGHGSGESFFGPNALNALLGAGAVAGIMKGKSKVPHEAPMSEVMRTNKKEWAPQEHTQYSRPTKRIYVKPPEGYRPGIDPEHMYYQEVEDENAPPLAYKRGGYIHGASGGQTDDVKTSIPAGSYIMNATDVSLMGDGNSINGAKKLHEFESKFLRSGITKDYMPSHANHKQIPVYLSQGEYQLSPDTVSAIGKGDNAKGAKILDKARNKLRHQKGVKAILPPKAKHFASYIRG